MDNEAVMLDNPQSPEEWQTAVNLAAHVLLLDSLQGQGLVTSNKAFDVGRARATLDAGRARGYVPPNDALDDAPDDRAP